MTVDPWPGDKTSHGRGPFHPGRWPGLPEVWAMTLPPCGELSMLAFAPLQVAPGVLLGLPVLDTLPLCVLLVRISPDPSPLPRLGAPSGWWLPLTVRSVRVW
jgi:hypothetical protein